MDTVKAFQPKTHLAELLDRVAKGESITVTRHGKPIAQIVPIAAKRERARAEVIKDLLDFGKGRKLTGGDIREMIEEGRRY